MFSIQSGAFLNVNCRGDCEIRICEVELHLAAVLWPDPSIPFWFLRFIFENPDFDIAVHVILIKPKISYFKREDLDVFIDKFGSHIPISHLKLGRIYTSPKIIQDLVENVPSIVM